jgi:hypothetical protein
MTLEKQVRLLQIYTATLTLGFGAFVVYGFQETRQRFREIDVERVNIVEPDGKLRMVIANKQRQPDPIINGKTFAGARKGAKSAGIIFFNDEGDECGGLAYTGQASSTGPQADGALLFDQFHQDQTVGIMYSQSGARRSAGLHVWDRPDTPADVLVEKMQAIERMPDGPAKQAELVKIKDSQSRGELGAHRVFVGKGTDGSAGLTIADRLGKDRIVLVVDEKNAARLRFLDDAGKVVYSIPADTAK